uniref:Uncharacterized protein n=1 Tax=Lotharella oceanica TaxID=641309 RepID=A0A7S2TUJ6_9EUKA
MAAARRLLRLRLCGGMLERASRAAPRHSFFRRMLVTLGVEGKKGNINAELPTELAVLKTLMDAEKATSVDEAFRYFGEEAYVIKPSGSPIEPNPSDFTTISLGMWGLLDVKSSLHGVDTVVEKEDRNSCEAFYTAHQSFIHEGKEIEVVAKFRADMVKDEGKGWVIQQIERLQ